MRNYWDEIASEYQAVTRIACDDFHYGPLLPGDRELHLLPADVSGLKCLEIGCGAAQNSVYLAKQGARCFAVDNSRAQLQHADKLMRENAVSVELFCRDMDCLPPEWNGAFDLVHSAYALAFADDQAAVIRAAADVMKSDGRLFFSTAHPLFTQEWVQFEDGETGLIVDDYFHPPEDHRTSGNGLATHCRPKTIECLVDYCYRAGLTVDRLLEPRPLPVNRMQEQEIVRRVPYDSPAWRELLPQMMRVPSVIICAAHKRRAA